MGSYHYKAFISYSHKDQRWGGWLHRRLEKYRIPKHLRTKHLIKDGDNGRLKPIFRDREELSAADNLGEKIEQAIAASENLIVICSPHAAKSHWVNQEILSFKRQNRGAKIFSIIVEGEPFSGGADECMPPALRFQLGADGELTDEPAEPLAADLRSTGDGKRLGVLKIISGMLGVGLDELVQRDMQRNRNRVTAITAGALATVLAMGTLTGFALSARKEADARRDAAEDMIEFMITELKPELEAVGRLKPLSIIGDRAAKYYEDLPLSSHNDNALGRQARIFHMIGNIEFDNKNGDLGKAQTRFKEAYASTKALLARDPSNADRIFDHSQSAYWAGYVPYRNGDYVKAETFFQEYGKLTKKLVLMNPDNLDWQLEVAYAQTNLAVLYSEQFRSMEAIKNYEEALKQYSYIAKTQPGSVTAQISLSNAYAWLADEHLLVSHVSVAQDIRIKQFELLEKLRLLYPIDQRIITDQMRVRITLVDIFFIIGKQKQAQSEADELLKDASKAVQFDDTDNGYNEILAIAYIKKAMVAIANGDPSRASYFADKVVNTSNSFINTSAPTRRQNLRVLMPLELLQIKILMHDGRHNLAFKTLSASSVMTSDITKLSGIREISLRIEAELLKSKILHSLNNPQQAKQSLQDALNIKSSHNANLRPNIHQLFFQTYTLLGMKALADVKSQYLLDIGVTKKPLNSTAHKGE